jgi:hypothetical protein
LSLRLPKAPVHSVPPIDAIHVGGPGYDDYLVIIAVVSGQACVYKELSPADGPYKAALTSMLLKGIAKCRANQSWQVRKNQFGQGAGLATLVVAARLVDCQFWFEAGRSDQEYLADLSVLEQAIRKP